MAIALNELGYTKIKPNIKATGVEMDIVAVHKTNGRRILCECKAHEQKIEPKTINKFFGILTMEIQKGNVDEGLFFSTSGFTSNTDYMYNAAGVDTKKTLKLYDTDSILQLFQQAGLLTDEEKIDHVVSKNTSYGLGVRYLVVYQSSLYIIQLLTLGDETASYTILKGTGNIVSIPTMEEIAKLDTTLQTLARSDLKITEKVTLNLLNLKQKTAHEISTEVQETVDDVKIALGDIQLQKVIQSHEARYVINVDIPSLTILTERFTSNESKFKFMNSTYIEKAIDDNFVEYVMGRFYLPEIVNIRDTLKTCSKIFPSVLCFLLLSDNRTYQHFYETKQKFMSRPDAQQFDDMISSIFFKNIYEETLNDLRHTPPFYLKQKQIVGYNNAFELKFGSLTELILKISGRSHTYIVSKGTEEIKAGEILAPVDISSNIALGNHFLAIEEYKSAIETYDIIIQNSNDEELLWMAWNNMSQAFRMMGQHEIELKCIEESLRYKISVEGLSNKILSLEALKRPAEEIEAVKTDLENLQSS